MPSATTRNLALLGGGLLIAGGLLAWSRRRKGAGAGPGGATYAFPSYLTGRKVTNAPTGPDGFVAASPAELARTAVGGPYDPVVHALARAVASEYSSGNAKEQAAVAWTIVNDAAGLRWDVPKLLMYRNPGGKAPEHTGRFGSQEQGRRFSTARDATDKSIFVATAVLSKHWPDPTLGPAGKGSVKFIDPSAQRNKYAKCPCDGPRDPTCRTCYRPLEAVLRDWLSEQREAVALPGTNADKILFIRPLA